MPKHEPFTPKAIGKRIKSKGLQKLKWYCQMCNKQCRDENGFKCHTTSESHQRQLLLFAENPHKYMDAFSQEFLKDFVHLLKTRFGTKRVYANQVYQEYIKDRNHLHMNATRWVTLTGLVKWMGRKGIAHADCTEKGWFITYIDRDPETLQRQDNLKKKEKMEKDYDERMAKVIEEQIERGKMCEKVSDDHRNGDAPPVEFKKDNDEQKITFSLSASTASSSDHQITENVKSESLSFKKPLNINALKLSSKSSDTASVCSMKRKRAEDELRKSALDEIIEENERHKMRKNKMHDDWLLTGIVVKVMADLGEKYYKKKGIVESVEDKYTGIIRMMDSNDVLKVDQNFLETVIPQIGRDVLVVKGAHRGSNAKLIDVNFDEFCATIRIESGPMKGRVIEDVKYDEISKIS